MGRYLAILDATTGRHADAPGCDKSDKSPPLVASVAYVAPSDSGEWREADWRTFYEERAAIREYDGRRPRPEAERLACGETLVAWHKTHGEAPPRAFCAGCGEPVSGAEIMEIWDGARVHLAPGYGCLIAYGRRWRAAAAKALAGMGIVPLGKDDWL